MGDHNRYAFYIVPDPGALSEFGARWLGWDIVGGKPVPQYASADLPAPIEEITLSPAKYGFHGTIKPPMRLAQGRDLGDLIDVATTIFSDQPSFALNGLRLARLGNFLALTPTRDIPALRALAEKAVTKLDDFRAPMTDAERERRQPKRLSDRQRTLLDTWGYPYVLDEFQFHMTLTGRLPHRDASRVERLLASELAPVLAEPVQVSSLSLCGERADGRFEVVARIPFGA